MKLEIPFSKLELRKIIRTSIWLSLLFVSFTSLITTQKFYKDKYQKEYHYTENAFVITEQNYYRLDLAFNKEVLPFYFYGFLLFFLGLVLYKLLDFKEEDYIKEIHSYSHKIKSTYNKSPISFNILLSVVSFLMLLAFEEGGKHPFPYFISFSIFIFLIRKVKILEILALVFILLSIILNLR